MTYETLLLETRGRVAIITLNRPQALNALNSTVLAELRQLLGELQADDGIGAVAFTIIFPSGAWPAHALTTMSPASANCLRPRLALMKSSPSSCR